MIERISDDVGGRQSATVTVTNCPGTGAIEILPGMVVSPAPVPGAWVVKVPGGCRLPRASRSQVAALGTPPRPGLKDEPAGCEV